MAHPQQAQFVSALRQALPAYFAGRRVLEIGSLDINGSVRGLFAGGEYVGLDLGPGRGVDVVGAGEDYGAPARSFDVVICCETMEHNPRWRETWLNMLRLLRGDGLLVMTCATEGRPRHGTRDAKPEDSPFTAAGDYYRNLVIEDFLALAHPDAWFAAWAFFKDCEARDLHFFGLGREAPPPAVAAAGQLREALLPHYRRKNIEGIG